MHHARLFERKKDSVPTTEKKTVRKMSKQWPNRSTWRFDCDWFRRQRYDHSRHRPTTQNNCPRARVPTRATSSNSSHIHSIDHIMDQYSAKIKLVDLSLCCQINAKQFFFTWRQIFSWREVFYSWRFSKFRQKKRPAKLFRFTEKKTAENIQESFCHHVHWDARCVYVNNCRILFRSWSME